MQIPNQENIIAILGRDFRRGHNAGATRHTGKIHRHQPFVAVFVVVFSHFSSRKTRIFAACFLLPHCTISANELNWRANHERDSIERSKTPCLR